MRLWFTVVWKTLALVVAGVGGVAAVIELFRLAFNLIGFFITPALLSLWVVFWIGCLVWANEKDKEFYRAK